MGWFNTSITTSHRTSMQGKIWNYINSKYKPYPVLYNLAWFLPHKDLWQILCLILNRHGPIHKACDLFRHEFFPFLNPSTVKALCPSTLLNKTQGRQHVAYISRECSNHNGVIETNEAEIDEDEKRNQIFVLFEFRLIWTKT